MKRTTSDTHQHLLPLWGTNGARMGHCVTFHFISYGPTGKGFTRFHSGHCAPLIFHVALGHLLYTHPKDLHCSNKALIS